jgi:hypothetical protein
MPCSSPERDLLTFWLAGSLDAGEAERVARHVATCDSCRSDAAEARELIEGLRTLHLTAEEVAAVAAGEMESPHVLACEQCRHEVAQLKEVNATLAAGSGRSPLRRRWMPLGVAALAAAADVADVVLVPRSQLEPRIDRGPASPNVMLAPMTMSDGGVPTFRWTPTSNATRYRVSVFTVDGRPVWTRDVDAPPINWPAEEPRTPGNYTWNVDAFAGSTIVARARLSDFEVTR